MEKDNSAVVEANDEQENPLAGPETEGNYFLDESSDEDDFMVTIGEIRSTPSGFSHHLQKQQSDGQTARVELDATPLCNGSIIYDSDLANMVDRPWTKPGANVTDYFNYGFSEDTWNQYCERQKKFRTEFGDQSAVNKAILDGIHLPSDSSSSTMLSSFAGGRQLLRIVGGEWPQPRARRMVIPLKPLQPNVESLAENEAAYVSQNVAGVDDESRAATNSSSNIYSSQTIPGLSENVRNEASVPMHQDFTVPPPIDFLTPLPIDFTKPPPLFIRPSEKEINWGDDKVGETSGYGVSYSMDGADDGTSTFPISTVFSSNCQLIPSDVTRVISQPTFSVEAPPGLDGTSVPSFVPIPKFPVQFKREALPKEEEEFGGKKRATSPVHKSRDKKHKRSKRDEDDRTPGVDSEAEMAYVFQKAFLCKQGLKSPSKDGSKEDKAKLQHKRSRHSDKKSLENSRGEESRHSVKKNKEKSRDEKSSHSEKKHKKCRTSERKG